MIENIKPGSLIVNIRYGYLVLNKNDKYNYQTNIFRFEYKSTGYCNFAKQLINDFVSLSNQDKIIGLI